MSHTPEPWESIQNGELNDHVIFGGADEIAVTKVVDEYLGDKANATRIVACVNACAGMIDPEKEIKAMREQLAQLKVDEKWVAYGGYIDRREKNQ